MKNYFDYIDINNSTPDNRNLIMPHQQSAVDAMTNYFKLDEDIQNRNGVVVMPTGSGKTFTAVNWLLSQGVTKGYRVLWLVHRQELVEQTYNEFVKQAPILNGTGISKLRILPVSGRHLHMSIAYKSDIYVCSIASVANKYGYRFIERMLGAQGKRKLIVVIDEAHHAVAGNYQKVLKRVTALNPNRVLLGLTATPKRMQKYDQGALQKLFNIDYNVKNGIGTKGYVYEITLKELIASRFLAKPKYIPVETQLIGEIEFNCTPEDEAFFAKYFELSERLKDNIAKSSARNSVILKQYLDNKEIYGKTLIFAVNQGHAETLCEEFKKAGISCDYAISNRSDAQDVIARFKNNEFDVLINVQIMTEGSDVPDIKTVFLTRETNSESLLLQMIGRGLRGPKAKGTDVAYIVSFHDNWETFAYWLDPKSLDIFEDYESVEIEEKDEILPEVAPNELMAEFLEGFSTDKNSQSAEEEIADIEEELVSKRDIYLKLYHLMKVNLLSEEKQSATAVGWYSVIDENGDDIKLLVFDSQIDCYNSINNNISLLRNKMTPELLLDCYFDSCDTKPDEIELQYLIDYIDEFHKMPAYFELTQSKLLDTNAIAKRMNSLFAKEEDKEAWLKELYDKNPILQQIYHYFFAFKKTVFDAVEEYKEADIAEIERQRKEYEYVENYFDLQELLKEVLEQYPKLKVDNLLKIAWSNDFVRNWYALCTSFVKDGKLYFQIHVNKIFSSPKVDKEVVKYLIFHELLHSNGYWSHDNEFRSREWQYPNSTELDGFLDSIFIEYNMDEIVANSIADEHYTFEELEPEYNKNAIGVVEGFKYCRNCGNKLPSDALFCDKCGAKTDY